jgi:hypothetical protein
MHNQLIQYIARKEWWHVPPVNPNAYSLRGIFYHSTFREAEFYGRPSDPERVTVSCPLVGDNDSIEQTLFGKCCSNNFTSMSGQNFIEARFALDAKMKKFAAERGYDSIVLMTSCAYAKYISNGKIPRSIELNVFI